MFSSDWTPSDQPPETRPGNGSAQAILTAISEASASRTGRNITAEELDADLSRDFAWDWMIVGAVLWDAAERLGIAESARRFSPRTIREFLTVRHLVEYLGVELARSASGHAQNGTTHNGEPQTGEPQTGEPPRGHVNGHAHGNGQSHGNGHAHPQHAGTNGWHGTAKSNGHAHRAPALPAVEPGFPMPVEYVAGAPDEMGRQYGERQALNIRRYIERNVAFMGLERLKVIPELQSAIADPTIYFGPDEVAEIKAMSAAADIPWDYVLGHNIGIHPDYVPGCSQFAVCARRNPEFGLVHGVNEDLPVSLRMRENLTRVMTVRRPKGGVPHITFGIAGQVGGLNGVNAAGLFVSSTLLLDRPRRPETEHGLIQPVIVKRVLEAATTIPEAIDIVRSCRRNGAWSTCISHFPTDRICCIEYDGPSVEWTDHLETVVGTNHCQQQPPLIDVPRHSMSRLMRLHSMLNLESNRGLSPPWARTILRDRYDVSRGRETRFPTMHTIRRVDNQGSYVFVPGLGELWATAGPMAPKMADRYFRISLSQLFGGVYAPRTQAVGERATGA